YIGEADPPLQVVDAVRRVHAESGPPEFMADLAKIVDRAVIAGPRATEVEPGALAVFFARRKTRWSGANAARTHAGRDGAADNASVGAANLKITCTPLSKNLACCKYDDAEHRKTLLREPDTALLTAAARQVCCPHHPRLQIRALTEINHAK